MRSLRCSSSILPALTVLAFASPASAALIVYDITLLSFGTDPIAAGTVVADDSGYTPGGLVPLSDLDIVFDEDIVGGSPIAFEISECGATAQGQVDGAGVGLVAVVASCADDDYTGGVSPGPPPLELGLDGSFSMVLLAGIIEWEGTYELSPSGVLPEPGAAVLLAAALALAVVRTRSS